MKICKTCQKKKPTTEFYPNKNTKDKFQSSCKTCALQLQKKWYEQNPSKNREWCKQYYSKNKHKWRERSYKNKYGLTIEEVNEMLLSQNNQCPICQSAFKKTKYMNIDHNHQTGKMRQILCSKCNTAIGLLDENIERFRRAIDYLHKWS